MKLSVWAKNQGIQYRTAWNWFKEGKLPVKSEKMPSGAIIVYPDIESIAKEPIVDIYGRVSSSVKKGDLQSQVNLCQEFCISRGYSIRNVHKEVASGMNDNRPKLNKIFDNPPDILIVLHKDRLTRFGFNYIEKLLLSKKCELVVINRDDEDEVDLMKDFIAIITSFCCRLYGARRGQSKASNMKEELNDKN